MANNLFHVLKVNWQIFQGLAIDTYTLDKATNVESDNSRVTRDGATPLIGQCFRHQQGRPQPFISQNWIKALWYTNIEFNLTDSKQRQLQYVEGQLLQQFITSLFQGIIPVVVHYREFTHLQVQFCKLQP